MDKSISLSVCEIFTSIQGESTYSGLPFFFIRLSGCNLLCNYCDSIYAHGEGRRMSVWELLSVWRKSGLKHVLITGGEPLLQAGVYALMAGVVERGGVCLLETNGSLSVGSLPCEVIKVVDWKTPGSGAGGSFLFENLRFLTKKDQIKFVLTSRSDYKWASGILQKSGLSAFTTVLMSPCPGKIEPAELAAWIVEDRLEARLQLQLHKVIWGDQRGR